MNIFCSHSFHSGMHLLFVVVINVHLLTIKLKCLSLGIFFVVVVMWACVSLSCDYSAVVRWITATIFFPNIYHMYIFAWWRIFFHHTVCFHIITFFFEKKHALKSIEFECIVSRECCCACVHFSSYNPRWRCNFFVASQSLCAWMYFVCNPYRLQFSKQ